MDLVKLSMGRIIWIVLPILLVWLTFFRSDEFGLTAWAYTQDVFRGDDWIGWIHPFGTEVNKVVSTGPFDSLEQCQNDAFERLERSFNEWKSAEYYCGYQCDSDDYHQRDQDCKVVRK